MSADKTEAQSGAVNETAMASLAQRLLDTIASDPTVKDGGPSQGNAVMSALGFLLVEAALAAEVPVERLVLGIRTQYRAQESEERVFATSAAKPQ